MRNDGLLARSRPVLNTGPAPRFVKRYADVRSVITAAAASYAREVAEGTYPDPEHSFE